MSSNKAVLVALALLALFTALVLCIALAVYGATTPKMQPTGGPPSETLTPPGVYKSTGPGPKASAQEAPIRGESFGPATAPSPHLKPQTFRPTSATAKLQLLTFEHFAVGYDNDKRNPAWVIYDLDGPPAFPGAEAKRPAKFKTDERTAAKVRYEDYSNSGYDRGHMCPSYAEFSRFGEAGEDATFIMSNVIPQPHSLNAGLWEEVEVSIAGRAGKGGGWAESLGHLAIINGPVYGALPDAMPSGVAKPSACYSIVLDYVETSGIYRALAFEMPDRGVAGGRLGEYLVSIKRIEDDTGLDVFAGVDPAVRAQVEAESATALW